MIIAIDGPAGSGKSTVANAVARHLGFFCLSSGYIYRGLTYVLKTYYQYSDQALHDVALQDVQAIMQSGQLRYEYISGLVYIFWGQTDITPFLKTTAIDQQVAYVAQKDQVRAYVKAYERQLVLHKDAVVEGRASGISNFADASIKIYVTADIVVRAQREVLAQKQRGHTMTQQQALEIIAARDTKDMQRAHDPLRIPQGATIVDTTDKTKDMVFDEILEVIKKYLRKQ